ncbi:MAG TPA: NlpC/P60 family protein [Adhaeribacter sp.]|nr:NlpC/P60 family protein [Adhaeribacter sp.]
MKNSILICFAIVALGLSYFYEVRPSETSGTNQNQVFETAMLVPFAPDGDKDKTTNPFEKAANQLTFKDSLFYNYHAQNMAVNLQYNEDKELLETISEWIGTPYRSGSSTKKGTDCSGFVTRVYQDVYGINLSRSSRSMFNDVKRIKKDSMRTGDLVFFRRSPSQPIYHVGIYLKDHKFVHSATNGGVMISSLKQAYYQRNFYAAGRVN